MVGNLDLFSRRAGFNSALRHFKFTTGLIEPVSRGGNIADLLREAEVNGTITKEQTSPILSALLVDKFEYAVGSRNCPVPIDDAADIVKTLSEWTAFQIVLVYQHPEVGPFPINPRNPDSWESALPVLKDELIVVYLKDLSGKLGDEEVRLAVDKVHDVLAGRSVEVPAAYKAAGIAAAPAAKPAPAAQPAAAKKPSGAYRKTPQYSVVVTNELFHNGNVEAWKRIIQSYRQTYSDLDVLIYYDNERIKDINTLFKWGKVKHGTPILISVAGTNIKDVSKLQRYLFEGASPRFENFLKGSIDQPLELF
jgi:hypothetical protein